MSKPSLWWFVRFNLAQARLWPRAPADFQWADDPRPLRWPDFTKLAFGLWAECAAAKLRGEFVPRSKLALGYWHRLSTWRALRDLA